MDDDHVWYLRAPRGKENGRRVHDVKRHVDNDRGTLRIAYTCDCHDYDKNGLNGCVHTMAEQIVRREIVVVGEISAARVRAAHARRRPPRKRLAHDGTSVRTSQARARTNLGEELPRLITSLVKAYPKRLREKRVAERDQNVVILTHRPPTEALTRAACLLYKVAHQKSYESMRLGYARLIGEGRLSALEGPPHANSLSNWMQDHTLTPILKEWLTMTAEPFYRREIGAIIDSSKVSQMRTAHHRGAAYQGDEREGADWMRCHVIVGVETMVVMAIEFGPNRGLGKTHDTTYLRPLVTKALKTFGLHFLLGDKAYWDRSIFEWLWDTCGIRAVVPAKKNTIREPGPKGHRREEFDPYWDLVAWQHDALERLFHEIYRLRPKIEGWFSLLKRVATEQMWSRGRGYKHPDGSYTYEPMKNGPCTAWVNEALCKAIYMNLRTTNTLQEETGQEIDYLVPGRCFPPPAEPLLRAAA